MNKKIARILVIALLTWVVFTYVITIFQVKGSGLSPDLKDQTWHVIFKQYYLFAEPKSGDLVGIKLAGDSVFLTSKIVAVPKDVLEIKSNQIILPNKEVIISFKKYQSNKISLGRDEYFVNSNDSDNPVTGIVDKERIIGKIIW